MSLIDGVVGLGNFAKDYFSTSGFFIIVPQTKITFKFDTYMQNSFQGQSKIAQEPLENGTFSSDARQITPNIVKVTATKAISLKTILQSQQEIYTYAKKLGLKVDDYPDVASFKKALEGLTRSDNLVTVAIKSRYSDYSELWKNYYLTDLQWQNDITQQYLVAQMTFQEVRMTTPQYTNIQQQNITNPENSNTAQDGTVQAKQPEVSLLSKATTYLKGLI